MNDHSMVMEKSLKLPKG